MTRYILLTPDGTYVTLGTGLPTEAEISAARAMLKGRSAWIASINRSFYSRSKPSAQIILGVNTPRGFDAAIEKAWKSARCAAFPGRARAAVSP